MNVAQYEVQNVRFPCGIQPAILAALWHSGEIHHSQT